MRLESSTYLARHAKCRDGLRCQGPGCVVRTGKTRWKRMPVEEKLLTEIFRTVASL